MTTVIHLKQINTLFHFTFERRLKSGGRLLIFTLLSACFSRSRSPIAHTVAGTMLKYWAVYTERGQWKPPQPVRQYRKATVDSHNICRCSDPSRTLCCPLFSWKENRAAISWLNCTNLYSPKSFWTGPIIWFWVQNAQNKLSESITSWRYNVHISTAGIRRGSTGVNPSIQVCVWRQKKRQGALLINVTGHHLTRRRDIIHSRPWHNLKVQKTGGWGTDRCETEGETDRGSGVKVGSQHKLAFF